MLTARGIAVRLARALPYSKPSLSPAFLPPVCLVWSPISSGSPSVGCDRMPCIAHCFCSPNAPVLHRRTLSSGHGWTAFSAFLPPRVCSLMVNRQQQMHGSHGITPTSFGIGELGLSQSRMRWRRKKESSGPKAPCVVSTFSLGEEPLLTSDNAVNEGLVWEAPGTDVSGRFVIVDGTAIVYRSYFKMQAQATRDRPMNDFELNQESIVTLVKSLKMILQLLELGPSHVAICFDARGKTFRHELYELYKGTRPPTPETILEAIPLVLSALIAMGLKPLRVFGVEADDVIATLTKTATEGNMQVCICSPDKDFFQLLSPKVRLLRPLPRGNGIRIVSVSDFESWYPGVSPHQFADMQALMGDQADNVPGVRGIGPKTAHKLIKKYGSVENVMSNVENMSSDRYRKALENDLEAASRCKRLVTLKMDLPDFIIRQQLSDFAFRPPMVGTTPRPSGLFCFSSPSLARQWGIASEFSCSFGNSQSKRAQNRGTTCASMAGIQMMGPCEATGAEKEQRPQWFKIKFELHINSNVAQSR